MAPGLALVWGSRQLDLMADELNWTRNRMMVTQSVINGHWARELRLKPLNMDKLMINPISPGAFYLHPMFFPHPCLAKIAWKHTWILCSAGFLCSQSLSHQLCHFHFLHCWVNLKMPRRRGVSRRGGSTATRGRASYSTPQNVIPITSASPSSPPSGQAHHLPHNSFQTTRFTFHSRLNKPVLTASITVILAEEEDHPKDSAHTSSSQSQEDKILQGEMAGVMSNADNMQEDCLVPEVSTHQADSNQHDVLSCEPVPHEGGVLNLVTPLEGGTDGIEDSGLVTWMASSSRLDKTRTNSPIQDA